VLANGQAGQPDGKCNREVNCPAMGEGETVV